MLVCVLLHCTYVTPTYKRKKIQSPNSWLLPPPLVCTVTLYGRKHYLLVAFQRWRGESVDGAIARLQSSLVFPVVVIVVAPCCLFLHSCAFPLKNWFWSKLIPLPPAIPPRKTRITL